MREKCLNEGRGREYDGTPTIVDYQVYAVAGYDSMLLT